MSYLELSNQPLDAENKRLIQLALYYDFVLYNMQQKPFCVLLVNHGGAINNAERGTMITVPNKGQPSLFVKMDRMKIIHDVLKNCLLNKSDCVTRALKEQVEYLKETLYVPSKIGEFKLRNKQTPEKLYDLLNPGDGDINTAIQNAAKEIMEYEPSKTMLYPGNTDKVFELIFKQKAVQFLDDATVDAMRSIMEPEIALPRKIKNGGRRTQRRGSQCHNRRTRHKNTRCGCKNKKRTRRHY